MLTHTTHIKPTHTAMHTQKYISGDKGWETGLVRGGCSAQSHLFTCFHLERAVCSLKSTLMRVYGLWEETGIT